MPSSNASSQGPIVPNSGGDSASPNPSYPTAYQWGARWSQLASAHGLHGGEPVVVALSGGADSVLLLHLIARATPRPRVLAVHVDHGLRGEESIEDAGFCARLCARLAVPFACRRVQLDSEAGNLEERAREARYRLLAEEAQQGGFGVILTGHHEDDALETLLMRWMRGTALEGLAGVRPNRVLRVGDHGTEDTGKELRIVRPLRSMRREEVRRLLRDHGLEWREDSSNESERFTRNRVRGGLLPTITETCGEEGLSNLRAFASAVESLEEELAARTAHLAWSPPVHAPARRSSGDAGLGGTLPRAALADLAPPLLRRALWRLVTEGTGGSPSKALLAEIEIDLATGATTRHSLGGGWTLVLRSDALHLVPPVDANAGVGRSAVDPALDAPRGGAPRSTPNAFEAGDGLMLSMPGRAALSDGRAIRAEVVQVPADREAPQSAIEVELDPAGLSGPLTVRAPRAGDRFHGLGAPGSRPLSRFLADAGVPREERGRIPCVFAGDELIWVAGIRPCEARRVRPGLTRRLRLRLEGAAEPTLS